MTPNLSAGGEVFWLSKGNKSGTGFAARHTGKQHVATCQLATTGLASLTYVHRVSEKVTRPPGWLACAHRQAPSPTPAWSCARLACCPCMVLVWAPVCVARIAFKAALLMLVCLNHLHCCGGSLPSRHHRRLHPAAIKGLLLRPLLEGLLTMSKLALPESGLTSCSTSASVHRLVYRGSARALLAM